VRTSMDVRDHGCQERVIRCRPDRRKRSPVGQRKRGENQRLNQKAGPGRNQAAAPFQRNMNFR
jgi:hypothetical protein